MEEYERCVRCGSCLKFCPLFQVTGEEQYSPRGKAYLLQVMDQIEDDQELGKEFRQLLFQCTMCGRCAEICSSDVDLLEIWHRQRARALETAPEEFEYLESLRESLANVKNIYGFSPEDRAVFWIDELIDELPNIEDRIYAPGKTAETVVFLGCLMSFRATQVDVVKALFKTLEKMDADYLVMGAEEFCCSHPLHLMGRDDAAVDLRKHNKEVIEATEANTLVTCCPGCLIQLARYHDLEGIAVLHHTQFFARELETLAPSHSAKTFAYHDPCELHRIMNVRKEPRALMDMLGIEYRDLDAACCGGGGLLRMTDPNLSDKIIEFRKESENLEDMVVLTCCPSCREQLLNAGLKTRDIVELLFDSLAEDG
jgi:Fe-S oxidoreductase